MLSTSALTQEPDIMVRDRGPQADRPNWLISLHYDKPRNGLQIEPGGGQVFSKTSLLGASDAATAAQILSKQYPHCWHRPLGLHEPGLPGHLL